MAQSKCQELEQEVAKLNSQLSDAYKMTQLDQDTIAQLREVIGKIKTKSNFSQIIFTVSYNFLFLFYNSNRGRLAPEGCSSHSGTNRPR